VRQQPSPQSASAATALALAGGISVAPQSVGSSPTPTARCGRRPSARLYSRNWGSADLSRASANGTLPVTACVRGPRTQELKNTRTNAASYPLIQINALSYSREQPRYRQIGRGQCHEPLADLTHIASCSGNAFATFRSRLSSPSLNQPYSRACCIALLTPETRALSLCFPRRRTLWLANCLRSVMM
jgi:hypothetical protein